MAKVTVLNPNIKNNTSIQLVRTLERILEDADRSGVLNLSGRTLKEFPKVRKEYNLSDTVNADLSKNRFSEVPPQVTEFHCLEKLNLYHNVLRSLPDNICALQFLVYLDLSRNQLQWLPPGLCQLASLQVLLLSNNRLGRLPMEMGNLANLAELDVSANQLTLLPATIGRLCKLRALSVRRNQLTSIPVELAALRLEKLDMSANQISALPIEFRVMSSLVELELDQNPLVSPPSSLCTRGKVHIFKFLESLAQRGDSRRTVRMSSDTLDGRSSGKRRQTLPGRVNCRTPDPEMFYDSNHRASQSTLSSTKSAPIPSSLGLLNGAASSGQSTPSTLSPGAGDSGICIEEILAQAKIQFGEAAKRPDKLTGLVQLTEKNNTSPSASSHSPPTNSSVPSSSDQISEDKNGPLTHIQTYREYKEALRLQRWQPQDIYRKGSPPETGATPTTPSEKPSPESHLPRPIQETRGSPLAGEKKRDPKMEAVISYVKSQLPNGHSSPKTNTNARSNTLPSPKTTSEATLVTTSAGYINNNSGGGTSPKKTVMRNGKEIGKLSPSRTLSFTMRREHEKAKEEALLIAQLRQSLEQRLKLSLSAQDLAAALQDGVVLCHLANHVRPRSVASVHVPSPAVPKLTMARCRRNVDNFLEACRRIGVPEESVTRLSESFGQSESSCMQEGDIEKHCENLITVILDLLDRGPVFEQHQPAEKSAWAPGSTRFLLALFFVGMILAYLMPEYE